MPNGGHSAKFKTLALGIVLNYAECPLWHSAKFRFLQSAETHGHSAKFKSLLSMAKKLSCVSSMATLPSVLVYALGKVTNFFLFLFPLLFVTNITKIYHSTETLQAVIITNM